MIQSLESAIADLEANIEKKKEELAALKAELRHRRKAFNRHKLARGTGGPVAEGTRLESGAA